MIPKALIRGLIFIATLAALGFLVKTSDLSGFLDKTWIDSEIRGKGLWGTLLFAAACALATGIGLPRQLVSFLGGYAYGFLAGTAIALAATTIGCAGAFFYSRLLGRSLVAAKFPGRIRRIDDFLSDNPFSMTLLIRLLPLGSNLITNLAAGVSSAGAAAFISGSALGYIPQTMVFALAGSGINLDPVFRISLSIVLFVVSGLLGVSLYRRYRHGKTFDEGIEQALGGLGGDPPPVKTIPGPE